MITDTSKRITAYIRTHKRATAKELAEAMGISPQALFRQLAKLQAKNRITKIGSPPKVFYLIREQKTGGKADTLILDAATQRTIDANYLIITPSGERKEGLDGFAYWCNKTGQPIGKTALEYVETLRKYAVHKKGGFIDGTRKLDSTFPRTHVHRLFYLDFYSIERFGKTKLGQLLLYAKQSQNVALIKEIVALIQPSIERLIKKWKIDGVGFIPPTVKREIQFMKQLQHHLRLKAGAIPILKIKTEIIVPQKTLNKLGDRVENAQRTIVVNSNQPYKNILLIDDAVGSGATINETAAQLNAKGLCKGRIIGFAITGSFKGFDVISEV